MLGQRLDKSQTLPRLDGLDHQLDEGETLETQFDIMSIANSCPDLRSVLEESSDNDTNHNGLVSTLLSGMGDDVVDGIFVKNSIHIPHIPMKLPLSFRRSTSLNSLVADEFKETSNTVDGNTVGVMPGSVAKAIGKLEGLVQNDSGANQDFPSDFLRSSHTVTLHKSISTPSVPHIFGPAINVTSTDLRPKNSPIQFSQQQSSKRSFFKRKQKSKSNSINSHPPVVVQHYRNIKMDSHPYSNISMLTSDEENQESVGYIALSDPSLGLQDPDAECWAMFMGKDVVALLDDKEVKRQEHMYELILTEKHHCLTLALMHHLFVGGMKKVGYTRTARILFPGLVELLQVHFSFLRRMRERQLKFRDLGQPMDTLADLIMEQFSGEQWQQMVRLYGLLCSSHKTSLELFKTMQKEPKFAALVAYWSKEQLLARKNVPECLLLVAQRITKYPLLFEPLYKTAPAVQERDKITKTLRASRDLNEKVNERVAERERLIEFSKKIDAKSMILMGKRRIQKEDLTLVPSRRLLFTGTANVINRGFGGNGYGSGGPGSTKGLHCTVLILTDCLVFTQDISNNGVRYNFVSPPILPGIVMLNHLIVRENAGQNSSLFLVLGTGTDKPEMIQLDVCYPPNRKEWMNTILGAIAKSQQEGDITSDGDEECLSDSVDYQDTKTTRALEELQDQDRQILQLLRSRSKLVETLRTEKPHLWAVNHCEGKVEVLNAVSNASTEVQRMLHQLESNSVNGVNRSTSCVSEHMHTQGILPKRADTFGGFDSQQRSSIDFAHSVNNKVLFQMVIQLADLCGEMFQQMVPQFNTPHISQNQHQLQRRMEDLREAQQRLEAEKAEWQRTLASQKEELESQQSILDCKANDLRNEEKDIVQQREQLYRKLEALQRQGIRPNLDSVSPSQSTNVEKPFPTPSIQQRRTVSQTQLPVVTAQTVTATNGQKPAKQQIPHFLANSSAVKSIVAPISPPAPSAVGNTEPPKPLPRTLGIQSGISTKPPSVPTSDYITKHRSSQGKGSTSRGLSRGASQPVQQLLPYRLSEDLKTSSLPRGVGSRSSSSMSHSHSVDQQLLLPTSTTGNGNLGKLRSSSNTSHVLHHSNSAAAMYGDSSNPSYTDRMSSYYKNSSNDPRKISNGYMEYPYGPSIINSSVPIVHQRSGSSPIPMSTIINSNPSTTTTATTYPQTEEDFDTTKVLFL